MNWKNPYCRIYFVLVFTFLVTGIILKTENTISHQVAIELQKDMQVKIMRTLNASETKSRMRDLFDRDYDYVELVSWVQDQLNFTEKKPKPVPKDPFTIIELEEGKCGEFSILYVSACLAHGYQARLVLILRGSNHEWAEVKINGEWVHVDPTNPPMIHVNDPNMYVERNKTMHLVVAFKSNSYEIVTRKYNPKK